MLFRSILFGGTLVKYDKNTLKCKYSLTTTAYLINNSYYSKLLQNFKNGLEIKMPLDSYWNKLISIDNWYIVTPNLSIQGPSFSDIQNKFVNYVSYFN